MKFSCIILLYRHISRPKDGPGVHVLVNVVGDSPVQLGLTVIFMYDTSIYVHILGFLGLGMVVTFPLGLALSLLVRSRSDY